MDCSRLNLFPFFCDSFHFGHGLAIYQQYLGIQSSLNNYWLFKWPQIGDSAPIISFILFIFFKILLLLKLSPIFSSIINKNHPYFSTFIFKHISDEAKWRHRPHLVNGVTHTENDISLLLWRMRFDVKLARSGNADCFCYVFCTMTGSKGIKNHFSLNLLLLLLFGFTGQLQVHLSKTWFDNKHTYAVNDKIWFFISAELVCGFVQTMNHYKKKFYLYK